MNFALLPLVGKLTSHSTPLTIAAAVLMYYWGQGS